VSTSHFCFGQCCVSLVFCFVSSFFEANHFLYEVFFATINCFIWSSHIFKSFLLCHLFIFLKLLYAADFCMFCKFSRSLSTSVSFFFILFKWRVSLCVYNHFLLSPLKNFIFKKILLALLKLFGSLFSPRGGKFTFGHNK
jgi:hypothetical protein